MKHLVWLALLLPSIVLAQADPATEATQQSIQSELDAQTTLLTQIEANTSVIRIFYEGLGLSSGGQTNCDRVHLFPINVDLIVFENTYHIPSVFSVAIIPHFLYSNQRQITAARATFAEAEADLLTIFNKRNETSFVIADETVGGVRNCLNLNNAMLGLQ